MAIVVVALAGCGRQPEAPFDPADPARGPGGLVGNGAAVSSGRFAGEGMVHPAPRPGAVAPAADVAIPTCDGACQTYCDGLGLDNPVDAALCPVLWGVGLDTQPVDTAAACRRMFVDLVGRFPTRAEVRTTCEGKTWGQVARALIAGGSFVQLGQRRWADALLYNNEAVNVERIFDMDRLVGKLYAGKVAYDQFATILAAHPVLTRRHATPADRAEAAFELLLGRPPYERERADLGRLYVLWDNGYYDHPALGLRVPDAVIAYQCLAADGTVDAATKGECTSVLWGYQELILQPDLRARDRVMWSGLLRPEEWAALQAPGRILTQQLGFWEHAVSDVLAQYLGYDVAAAAPAVRQKLVEYVLAYNGDMRAAHHAVVTSQLYLQSSQTDAPAASHRWTYGPLRQIEVEGWIDTIKNATGFAMSGCDHRIAQPELLLENGSLGGYALVQSSHWQTGKDGHVVSDYRDLARTLGGCPENQVGGRFKAVSILTTATQEGFVKKVCNPGLASGAGVAVARLLPPGVDARRALDGDVAQAIVDHQVGLFLGRDASAEEKAEAQKSAAACTPKPCTAESFARPACYAILSSSELLFY